MCPTTCERVAIWLFSSTRIVLVYFLFKNFLAVWRDALTAFPGRFKIRPPPTVEYICQLPFSRLSTNWAMAARNTRRCRGPVQLKMQLVLWQSNALARLFRVTV